jgi:predicted HTH domain antitoxin
VGLGRAQGAGHWVDRVDFQGAAGEKLREAAPPIGNTPPSSYTIAVGQVAFEIPEESLVALKLDALHAAAEVRLAAAVKLYELGRLSSGAAANLAGVPRVAFLSKLAAFGVDTFRLSADDLERDMDHA